jgi:hypothetical protein
MHDHHEILGILHPGFGEQRHVVPETVSSGTAATSAAGAARSSEPSEAGMPAPSSGTGTTANVAVRRANRTVLLVAGMSGPATSPCRGRGCEVVAWTRTEGDSAPDRDAHGEPRLAGTRDISSCPPWGFPDDHG